MSLTRLDDLTLSDCDIVARKGFLALGSLTIKSGLDTAEGESLQIASPESLRALNLDLCHSQIHPLLTGFGPGILPQLVHLSITFRDVGDSDKVFPFLDRCPGLESLEILTSTGQSTLQFPVVHSGTVPLLRTLTGPPELIQSLTPNRPVTGVTVLSTNRDHSDDVLPLCMEISRSARPIQSLVLPVIDYPTLGPLVAIVGLFPDLRELHIVIGGDEFTVLGSHSWWEHASSPADTRSVDLCDDAVFDDMAADDISDTESDEPPTVIRAHTKERSAPPVSGNSDIHYIVRWILGGLLSLSPGIEVLLLEQQKERSWSRQLSLTEQQQAVAALSLMYPHLCQVQFGRPGNNWKRTGTGTAGSGGSWKGDAESSTPQQSRIIVEKLASPPLAPPPLARTSITERPDPNRRGPSLRVVTVQAGWY
ncbi:hypothetical protein MVEN_01380900 [Mycena venus]|uniref:F-box domain-containing protein n=1 Tax=Mycena venus TaxID=2733690 RepID=A0A8H6XXN1_9AGAR|nr:hypothetical protein MVEN_01380900 [Mycena venus]